ncbi:MAG TPA: NADH-quinone oxidoreductase subunit M [Tepidisphaeraceae bacterium]|jgi:NADH-quinone oxidoreductase subunit M
MPQNVWLLILLLVPLLGSAICALMPSNAAARAWALIVSCLTAGVSVLLATKLHWNGDFDLQWGYALNNPLSLESVRFGVKLGADAVSMWLILLTALLMPLAIAASFASITDRAKQYYAWMLLLLFAMMGVFVARDLLLFYVFFELTLVPMFFIIGIWGGPERRYAAAKFFLFTFAGSVFTLAVVIFIGIKNPGGFELNSAIKFSQTLPSETRFWIFLGLLAGFAVKVPLFPVHTWLPLAHTEAPTAGSVILAGVLLKLGTYGIYKLALPLGLVGQPGLIHQLAVFVAILCLIGIIYGALAAWVQKDIKKLVAYSSVSHLGFCVLGLVALNTIGISGSVLYMINHGLSTGAMFLVIGMIYDRFHTRDINELSGLGRRMPIMAFFFVFFVFSSVGLPGLNGFVSEFLTILGAFTADHLGPKYGAVAALGIILGALYMLHMTARVIFGPLKYPHMDDHGHTAHGDAHGQADQGQKADPGHGELSRDLNFREIAILVPLAIAVVVLGVKPNLVLKTIEPPVRALSQSPAVSPSSVAQAQVVQAQLAKAK